MKLFQLISESSTFSQLANATKKNWPTRIKNARYINSKIVPPSLVIYEEGEMDITFKAKSFGSKSTTGKTFSPRVRFFPSGKKVEDLQNFVKLRDQLKLIDIRKTVPKAVLSRTDLKNMVCKVHCNCPDYAFRMEYANREIGASDIVVSNGAAPVITNPNEKPGLCKHILGLLSYLGGGGEMAGTVTKNEKPRSVNSGGNS